MRGPQYLKEILFKAKEVLLSINFCFLIVLLLTISVMIHNKFVKILFTKGSRLMTVETPGQVPTLLFPKSGPATI